MKKTIFLITFLFAFVFSCKEPKPITYEYSRNLHNVIQGDFNKQQLDSILIVDTISTDMTNWLSAPFVDYETKEKRLKYMFVKSNGTTQTTYVLYFKDGKYNLTKRIGN